MKLKKNNHNNKQFKSSLFVENVNNLNNLKKLFFFINNLKRKKKYILIVGDQVIYKLIDYIFILKNKKKTNP